MAVDVLRGAFRRRAAEGEECPVEDAVEEPGAAAGAVTAGRALGLAPPIWMLSRVAEAALLNTPGPATGPAPGMRMLGMDLLMSMGAAAPGAGVWAGSVPPSSCMACRVAASYGAPVLEVPGLSLPGPVRAVLLGRDWLLWFRLLIILLGVGMYGLALGDSGGEGPRRSSCWYWWKAVSCSSSSAGLT